MYFPWEGQCRPSHCKVQGLRGCRRTLVSGREGPNRPCREQQGRKRLFWPSQGQGVRSQENCPQGRKRHWLRAADTAP